MASAKFSAIRIDLSLHGKAATAKERCQTVSLFVEESERGVGVGKGRAGVITIGLDFLSGHG